MQILPPVPVTQARIDATNVPETDAPVWDIATTYNLANTVIYEHAVYESLVGSNLGNQPDISATEWLRLGATNRFKPFDGIISDPAVQALNISYTLAHDGGYISGVAVFGLVGTSLEIKTVDPVDGTVFSQTYTLLDESSVVSWSDYFFSPVGVQRREILEIEIPPYINAATTITVSAASGDVAIGEIVLGRVLELGVTLYNTSLSIEDYSRKDRDQFGNPIIIERAFARLVDYDVKLPTASVRYVQSTLANIRARPVVWVGSVEEEYGTIVYGYYRRFDIVLSSPSLSDATIEVEGLV